MKIVVTGGAGFIGSHFVDTLLNQGHRVMVIDNLSSGSLQNVSPQAELEIIDLGESRVLDLLRDFAPQAIFHFAAQIDVKKSIRTPLFDAQENIITTLRLLDYSRHHQVHFIFASSGGAIYGEAHLGPQDENHSEFPQNPYGVAKLSIDRYLHAFNHQYGLTYTSMRFSNVYGPRQGLLGEAGVVSVFMGRAMASKPLTVNGDGLQTRDFVYVMDLARLGPTLALKRPVGVFNLATGVETTILELATKIRTAFGQEEAIQHAPANNGEQRRSVLSSAKAMQILRWTPETKLDQGLAQTRDWFRAYPSA